MVTIICDPSKSLARNYRNNILPLNIQYLTEKGKRLYSFDFSEDDVMKIIQKLDPKKAHSQDNVSIR